MHFYSIMICTITSLLITISTFYSTLTHILLLKQTHVDLQLKTMGEVLLNKIYNDCKDNFEIEYNNQAFISELKNIHKVIINAFFYSG